MKKHRVILWISLLSFWCVGNLLGQTTGTISGTVRDGAGAVVPSSTVIILNEDTGISRTIESDTDGRYTASGLNLGQYRVTGSREGFQTAIRKGIVLTVGREAVVDFALTVGAVQQSVEVTGDAPLVESTNASLGSLVDDRTIRALPLNGRSYDQLALLQPGVNLTSPGPPTGTSPFSFGSGKRFSVGGQRPNSNSFLLDGTNINDQANGTPARAAGTNLGVDTILEFKIFTSSYKAEYGHSAGSVISAVTRSGTNALHASLFEYIRNSALDARNFFDVRASPPSFKRNQFGGVVGGPIKKDKTFFFAGYEGLRQGLGTTQIATVPTALARTGVLPTGTVIVNPSIVPYLNLYPLPNGRNFGDGTGEFLSAPTIVTNEDNVMARIDHQVNAKNNLFGRYTFDQDNLNAPQSLPDLFQVTASRRQYTTLQLNTILSSQALNNVRFAFNRTRNNFDSVVSPNPGPQLSIVPGEPLGSFTIGGINSAGSRALTPLGPNQGNGANLWVYNVFEWGDDFTYVKGKHSFKAGTDIERLRANYSNPAMIRGVYTFTTFNDFLAGKPASLQAGSPLGISPYFGIRQSVFALYAQDDYKVNSRLTFNFGLRWETATDPYDVNGKNARLPSALSTATVPSDSYFSIGKKNFEPRFGMAWQLNASGRTVVRIGGGIFHNQLLPWAYFTATRIPPFFATFLANNPSFPNGYQNLTGGGLLSLLVQAPIEKTPVDDQYNVSIQQQISRNTIIQISYAGNRANHLLTLRDADTPIPTILPNGQKFFPVGSTRRNPTWNGVRVEETDGDSTYNAATITLRRQFFNGFEGQIFYTFGKAMDENSSTSTGESVRAPTVLLDPEDRARDWGLAEFDQRHIVVGNFTYSIPFRASSRALGVISNGWTLNGIATFAAGQPFTARLASAVSRNLSVALAERPDLRPGASQNPSSGTTAGCTGIPAGQTLGTADRYYDPCAFSLPLAGTYGNLGRNTIIGPGLADVDLALEKAFKLREALHMTFKAEVFNVMNHANFGLPNTTALTSTGAGNSAAGRITYTTTSSRQIQFAVRFLF